jgi:hypothetical protein
LDYQAQQAEISAELQVSPYYDPLFLDASVVNDPSTVLEGYSQDWNISRTTLAVTTSDILIGEDGTIEIQEIDHFSDDLVLKLADAPLVTVTVRATVTWTQTGEGDVDFTSIVCQAFQTAGSLPKYPLVSSLMMDGLIASWPKPGDSIGAGWTVGAQTSIATAVWVNQAAYGITINFVTVPQVAGTPYNPTITDFGVSLLGGQPFATWTVTYPLGVANVTLGCHYEASRDRTEILTFSVNADVQPIFAELSDSANDSDAEQITVSSDQVAVPLDAADTGFSSSPIGDPRRNSYFQTDRGQQSYQYLISRAVALLKARCRCVSVDISCKWEIGVPITTRQNVTVFDRRLPLGSVSGKVTSVNLKFTDDGSGQTATITIACSVGRGGTIEPVDGTPVYADDGYMDDGYQIRSAQIIALQTGAVLYETLDDFQIDDDNVNLLNMQAVDLVDSCVVTGAPPEQAAAAKAGANYQIAAPDPSGALAKTPTTVTLQLKSLTGQSFQTILTPTIATIQLPKTIDLETEI